MKIKKIKNFLKFMSKYEMELLFLNKERIKNKYPNLELEQIDKDRKELLKEIEKLLKD